MGSQDERVDGDRIQLGDRLRTARKEAGKSLRAVESETGISNSYLCQLEQGDVVSPSPRHLLQLAASYGCDYGELMKAAGYVPPPLPAPPDRITSGLRRLTVPETERVAEYIELLLRARSDR